MTHQDAFKFLTDEQLRKAACSIFTEDNAERVRKNYREVRTPNVIADLSLYGWKPVRAYQVKPKLQGNKGYQKHFIHFRNEEVFIGPKNKLELIPEIILTNSYDARASFKLYLSMYRPASGSGLVVSGDKKIAHRESAQEDAYKISDMEKVIKKITGSTLITALKNIQQFKSIHLDRLQQRRLAELLCRDRWNYKYHLVYPDQLTDAKRRADEGSSAWIVFCRIHEKILRGGWIGAADRNIKSLKDPNRELKINVKMWETASDYIQSLKKKN